MRTSVFRSAVPLPWVCERKSVTGTGPVRQEDQTRTNRRRDADGGRKEKGVRRRAGKGRVEEVRWGRSVWTTAVLLQNPHQHQRMKPQWSPELEGKLIF